MSHFLEILIDDVEAQAEWRAGKAEQYPDDKRNGRSSEALAILAKNLRALAENDDHARAYEAVMERLVEFEDKLIELPNQNRDIGRYGFDYPTDGDPRAFLSALTDECQELVDDAEKEGAEEERQHAYEEACEIANEEAKQMADEAAREVAEEAAKEAAEEAYREAYDEVYKEAYDEAYKEALIQALQE